MNKAKYLLILALLACGRNNKTCRPFEPFIPESATQGEAETGAGGAETITVIEEAEEILINNEAGSGAITFQ